HAKGFNRFFIPLAIEFALDTGMREQELFHLRWKDIDINKRTIYIRKSKTDHMQQSPGRTIPLPFKTMFGLWLLIVVERRRPIFNDKMFYDNAPIFPMSQSAFIQAFDGVVKRAGLADFEFRDIRREANSRWDDNEPPLTLTQRKTMLGQMGASGEINDVYSQSNLKIIRQKLDRQAIQMTFEEKFKDELLNGFSVHDIVQNAYWEPAIYFNSHKDANESFDTTFNAPPPNQEQKQIFAKTRELVDSLGDNPTEEQVKQLLDHFKNTRKAFSLKPKSEVKKLKLIPRNKEWSMEDTT